MSRIIITDPDELARIVGAAVKAALQGIEPGEPVKEPELIDGKELCVRLGIAYGTLLSQRKKGKLPFILIGDRIMYDYAEVIKALTKKAKDGGK